MQSRKNSIEERTWNHSLQKQTIERTAENLENKSLNMYRLKKLRS